MHEILKIRSKPAAAALEHPQSRRILLELVRHVRSLKDLGDRTELSPSLLHYHVNRLCALGLAEVVASERRAGRPVKRYRAVARKFLVPSGLAKHDTNAALMRALSKGLERDLARRNDKGVLYFVDDAGRFRMGRFRGSSPGRAFELWSALSLTAKDAESLGNDLRALFARYAQRKGNGASPVIAYCAFAER
jgi:DNA-binding transcriptional ArsR family regulator